MTYAIPLPWPKPPLTGNRTRGNPHARAAEVKTALTTARWHIRALVRGGNLPPLPAADLTLHLRVADRGRRDADGMFPTLKVVADALVQEGVLADDSWQHVPAATCRIHAPNGQPAEMWLTLDPPEQP